MSLIEKSEIEELREERVNVLRELSQGEGFNPKDEEKRERLRVAFGGHDLDLLNDLFEAAMQALGSSPFAAAIENALTYQDGLNLKDRREKFVREHGGSARNLMRYEVEGANLLVRQFEVVEDLYQRQQQFQDDEEDARDIDIRVLQERVTKLEEAVDSTTEATDSESSLAVQLEAARSLLEEQGQTLAKALERIQELEIAVQYHGNYVSEDMFRRHMKNGLSSEKSDVQDVPEEYQRAYSSIDYRVRTVGNNAG